MITVGMHYDVIAGREEDFESKFAAVLDVLHRTAGHVESHLFRDVHSPSSYIILSEWSSKEAYARFLESDAFKSTTAWGREQILAGRPRHRVFNG